HPLQGSKRIVDGLQSERAILGDLRANADVVIDTSTLNVHDLRRKVEAAFAEGDPRALHATVMSFGFKYGIPVDADMVADVRFLPNPHWNPELRPLTGRDLAVSSTVLATDTAQRFLEIFTAQIALVTPGYLDEGKRYVTIAVGCTGGKHRSVAMAEELGARLRLGGMETLVMHRDLGRE
ncbi:MAG: RNase adaptor protein RapZ, partial [Actinobacteria bacterium]|nr:RNase adaptor protein RapZ [Actinomycetota bacterium]